MRRRAFRVVAATLVLGLGVVLNAWAWSRAARPRFFPCGSLAGPRAEALGWAHEPFSGFGMPCPDDPGTWWNFELNAQGWKDVPRERGAPTGALRVLVVGDSVTFGFVPVEQGYPRVLERVLRERGVPALVFACGVGGWATDQELECLRLELAVPPRPDVVLLQLCANDLDGCDSPNARTPEGDLARRKRRRWVPGPAGLSLAPTAGRLPEPLDARAQDDLALALVAAAACEALGSGTRFGVLCESEDARSRAFADRVERELGIPTSVPGPTGYRRWRTDPHPDPEGNEALGRDGAALVQRIAAR